MDNHKHDYNVEVIISDVSTRHIRDDESRAVRFFSNTLIKKTKSTRDAYRNLINFLT